MHLNPSLTAKETVYSLLDIFADSEKKIASAGRSHLVTLATHEYNVKGVSNKSLCFNCHSPASYAASVCHING